MGLYLIVSHEMLVLKIIIHGRSSMYTVPGYESNGSCAALRDVLSPPSSRLFAYFDLYILTIILLLKKTVKRELMEREDRICASHL